MSRSAICLVLSACKFFEDGPDILKSEMDALFDALRGVAKTKDAARAHLDEQRQFSTRQVLHFVHVDPDELAHSLKLSWLWCSDARPRALWIARTKSPLSQQCITSCSMKSAYCTNLALAYLLPARKGSYQMTDAKRARDKKL